MWDVAIVGAGPAGSGAALAALAGAPGARVLLVDRSTFPRDKACGDGIAPHALDVLEGLRVRDAVAGFAQVQKLRLGFAGGAQVEGVMPRPGYVVPREVFDARLLAAAVERGATFLRHRLRGLECRRDAVVLDGEIAARTVIAADGANSVVRRLTGLAAPRQGHLAVAIRGYTADRAGGRQVIRFADSGWPAYAWSFPIGDGRANVGYGEMLPRTGALTRDYLLSRLAALLPGAGEGATGWRAHHLPLSSGRPRQPRGRVLFAGDALSLINPLTGEGIYYAVLSGALAGQAAADLSGSDPGARYRTMLRQALGRHVRHTTAAARLATHRWAVERALRAASEQRVFDDLVEIGLGRGLLTGRTIGAILSA